MTLFTWLLFFFVAFISKLLLGIVVCYLIFPADRTCDECDGETLPVRMGWMGRTMSWLMRGSLQRRWCPRCGWEGMTRTSPVDRTGGAPAEVDAEPATW
ncbi:MAG TPA: hypothetical protein VFQ45_07730 [Longimicrobium sp.]|nr:hypothetical protein [Longimicrobium sp.]